VETKPSNICIFPTDIHFQLPHGTMLKALIRMFADFREVGFLPPQNLKSRIIFLSVQFFIVIQGVFIPSVVMPFQWSRQAETLIKRKEKKTCKRTFDQKKVLSFLIQPLNNQVFRKK
jgi:hypothetical protein